MDAMANIFGDDSIKEMLEEFKNPLDRLDNEPIGDVENPYKEVLSTINSKLGDDLEFEIEPTVFIDSENICYIATCTEPYDDNEIRLEGAITRAIDGTIIVTAWIKEMNDFDDCELGYDSANITAVDMLPETIDLFCAYVNKIAQISPARFKTVGNIIIQNGKVLNNNKMFKSKVDFTKVENNTDNRVFKPIIDKIKNECTLRFSSPYFFMHKALFDDFIMSAVDLDTLACKVYRCKCVEDDDGRIHYADVCVQDDDFYKYYEEVVLD